MSRFISMAIVLLLVGCASEQQTGPGEVRWDRESCVRCAMSVGDHSYSAQVRGGPEGERTKLYKFDDIGCAVIWLDQQPWGKNPATEIWVNDHQDSSWIDARSAFYVSGKTTPMDYGLGAQKSPAEGALSYEQAVEAIYNKERQQGRQAHQHTGLPGISQ